MIRSIKIKNPGIPWETIREIIVFLVWSAILIVAAFGWGIIYENRRAEEFRMEVRKIDNSVKDLHGRITVLEGPTPKKAESKRQ